MFINKFKSKKSEDTKTPFTIKTRDISEKEDKEDHEVKKNAQKIKETYPLEEINRKELKKRIQAMDKEDQEVVASVLPAEILLKALEKEFERLNQLEHKINEIYKEVK